MYMLSVRQPDGSQVVASLPEHGSCQIGRARGRNGLVVSDAAVSGAHAIVRAGDGQLTIEDLGSSNGTFLAGKLLPHGEQVPLALDQPVDIGGSLLTVSLQPAFDSTRAQGLPNRVRYVGVLYTDIVGSTQQTERLGQGEALRLLEWHNETLTARIKRFNGRATKFTGDGYEAIFPSVQEALGCAAACQRALARRNRGETAATRLEVRMGVNGGEALVSGGRVFGMPLILAARVMAKAGPGQVLVPAHIAGVVRGSLLQFTPHGAHELKGLDGPVELLEFLWQLDPYAQTPLVAGLEP
jgi:class 3 adenylate cyclase